MKITRWEKILLAITVLGANVYAHVAYAAASRGGEEGMWWLFKLLGISYN